MKRFETNRYNDSGIRVRKTDSGTTHYLVDANNHTGYAQVLEELAAVGGTPTRSYLIGDDVLSQCGTVATEPSYLLYDGHGITRQLQHYDDSVSKQYNYDAYGKSLTTLPGTPETSFLYSGEQYDEDLGEYYLRARYLNPDTGRFNRLDPWSGNNFDPQSLHKYAYSHSDPVNGIDPSGKFSLTELVVTLVVIAVLITLYLTLRDRSVSRMSKIPVAAIRAEYLKQDTVIQKLEKASGDITRGKRAAPLLSYGLILGGSMTLKLTNDKDPLGQQIRDIWEDGRTQAGHSSALEEFGGRFHAGRGQGLDDYIYVMAFEELASTDEQYQLVIEALIKRQKDFKEWLERFLEEESQ